MVIECPLYAPVRLKPGETPAAAQDLSSLCQQPLAARRLIYDCYLMLAEFLAEDEVVSCLTPLRHPWLPHGR